MYEAACGLGHWSLWFRSGYDRRRMPKEKQESFDMLIFLKATFQTSKNFLRPILYPCCSEHRSFFLCLVSPGYSWQRVFFHHLSKNKIFVFLLWPECPACE